MKMQRVTSPNLKEPAPGTWSNCRVYGNQVFVAGMTASSIQQKMLRSFDGRIPDSNLVKRIVRHRRRERNTGQLLFPMCAPAKVQSVENQTGLSQLKARYGKLLLPLQSFKPGWRNWQTHGT